MNSRLISLVVGLCSVWLVSPASLAAPFVFTFDMPAFDQIGNIGVTSVLEVTVDNGGSSSLSQTWDSDQIIALSTDITGPTTSVRIQNGVETGAITTNAAGVPTLAFVHSGNYYAFGQDAGGLDLIQVGLDCDYGVYSGGSMDAAAGCSSTIWPITGRALTPEPEPAATAVPTMSAYALVLTMLGLLVAAGRSLRVSAKRR